LLNADGYLQAEIDAAERHPAGGRYLARGGDVEVLEGEMPAGRTVLLEFPNMRAALDWYRGDEYREIRMLRERAAVARAYVVDGAA